VRVAVEVVVLVNLEDVTLLSPTLDPPHPAAARPDHKKFKIKNLKS
jgi:hypothetical protein